VLITSSWLAVIIHIPAETQTTGHDIADSRDWRTSWNGLGSEVGCSNMDRSNMDIRLQALKGALTNSRDLAKLVDGGESSVLITPRQDARRHHRAHPWQRIKGCKIGGVEINRH
jgi:hypothetical protein